MNLINIVTLIIGVIGIVVIAWGIFMVTIEFCYTGYTTLFHKKTHKTNYFFEGNWVLIFCSA